MTDSPSGDEPGSVDDRQQELLREILAEREATRLAEQIDWQRARQTLRPPADWFEGDEPKPF